VGLCFVGLLCWFGLGWRGVCVVLIVCAPLKRRVHQATEWAQRDVRRWLALWRRRISGVTASSWHSLGVCFQQMAKCHPTLLPFQREQCFVTQS